LRGELEPLLSSQTALFSVARSSLLEPDDLSSNSLQSPGSRTMKKCLDFSKIKKVIGNNFLALCSVDRFPLYSENQARPNPCVWLAFQNDTPAEEKRNFYNFAKWLQVKEPVQTRF
jgi:hypothetical protein